MEPTPVFQIGQTLPNGKGKHGFKSNIENIASDFWHRAIFADALRPLQAHICLLIWEVIQELEQNGQYGCMLGEIDYFSVSVRNNVSVDEEDDAKKVSYLRPHS